MRSAFTRGCAFLMLALILPATFGAAPELPKVEAQVLEHGEYLCSNCFFGTSDYYYCFKADNRILIGHQKEPTLNFQDRNKNYFTKYRKAWTSWQATGASVSLKYDDKYIWLPNANGKKDVRLAQDYSRDVFVTGGECRAAVNPEAKKIQ